MKQHKRKLVLYAAIAAVGMALIVPRIPLSMIVGQQSSPMTLTVYYDDTNSGKTQTALQDRIAEIQRRAVEWFHTAPPGSSFEIYATAATPGQPERRMVYTRTRQHRSEMAAERRKLRELIETALTDIPSAPNSSIIEDVHALISRGARLETPYSLLVVSDLEQWTQHGLKGKPDAQKLLSNYPVPSRLPARISVIYTPETILDPGAKPKQTEELLTAWRTLLVVWCGQDESRVDIYEPQSAEKGTTK